ncbi:hypothetical protein QC762_106420 [Podospora pseudocomata]|uniref:Uncharacterized protein n=1 Tax=Podospora pseudocomata TaxID=2093779 RepID=A0ABR0GTA5_9PEZI|nr:hypothetical protein QC762_106420 [Podospora pseudocomata]
MAATTEKSARSRRNTENDIPDYKPLPLRISFLATVVLVLCGLIIALERLLHSLPHEDSRTEIPQEFGFIPDPRDPKPAFDVLNALSPEARQKFYGLPVETSLQDDPPSSTRMPDATTTSFPAEFNKRMAPDPRPHTSYYVNTNVITTYVTWANSWYGHPDNVMARTAVFPGEEKPNECMYNYQGVIITTNSSACQVIIAPDPLTTPPPGWKSPRQGIPGLWFSDECVKSYDDWYKSQLATIPAPPPGPAIPYPNAFMKRFLRCSWHGEPREETTSTRYDVKEPLPETFLNYYVEWDVQRQMERLIVRLRFPGRLYPGAGLYLWGEHNIGEPSTTSSVTLLPSPTSTKQSTFESVDTSTLQSEPSMSQSSSTSETTATETVTSSNIAVLPVTTSDSESKADGMPASVTSPIFIHSSKQTSQSEPASILETKMGIIRDSSTLLSLSWSSLKPTQLQSASTEHLENPSKSTASISTSTSYPTTPFDLRLTTSVPSPVPHQLEPSVKYVLVPVNVYVESTTQFTMSGQMWIKSIVHTSTSSILIGVPAVMVIPAVTTLTNSNGVPTSTQTDFHGELYLINTLTTLTNARGSPTLTATTQVPATSVITTLTDADGVPTATATSFPVWPNLPNSTAANLMLPNRASYFTIYFLPILLTIFLLIPVQAIDAEIKQLLPFRLLTKHNPPAGAGVDALVMQPGRISGWKLLWRYGDPISLMSDLVVLCVAGLISVSGETVGLKLRGSCLSVNLSTCFLTVAVFPVPARVAEGLLGGLIVLVMVLGFMLARWRTGTAADPSSVAGVCALLQVDRTREVLMRGMERRAEDGLDDSAKVEQLLRRNCEGLSFRLGRLGNWTGKRAHDYGIVVSSVSVGGHKNGKTKMRSNCEIDGSDMILPVERAGLRQMRRARSGLPVKRMTFYVPGRERTFQGVLLAFFCGLLILILYYELTEYEDLQESAFEWFMDSQGFGVRMLFTGLGVVLSFMWDHLFTTFSKRRIYQRMAQKQQPAALSVLEPCPKTVFTGLWRAVRQKDLMAGAVAFAGILSKFVPALLSSIPFSSAQTWQTHEICTWTTVALLIVLILTLFSYMWLVKWPHMPAAPDSLACQIYYVCDSAMLRDFERLSMLGRRERDRRVERMGRMYRFGWMTGVSGERRVGVDYPEGEQGYRMHGLGGCGFGTTGGK